MRRSYWLTAGLVLVVTAAIIAAGQVGIYKEQGGLRMVIGSSASLDVASGGELDIESGGAIKIGGTAMTSSAAELNVLDGVTAGTAKASAGVVLNTNKALDMVRLGYLYLFPGTAPATTEGHLYYDAASHVLKYYNASSWITLTTGSGDNTLDEAYDQGGAGVGKTITADTGAVTITSTDADAAYLLALTPTPGSAAALGGMSITSGAFSTQDCISLANSGGGKDIDGTSGTWSVTKGGVGTFADVQSATGTFSGALTATDSIVLANGQTITGDTNGEIEFTEAGEEFSLAFTSNTITLATDTDIDTLAFGVVDDLTGIGSIAFDAAASTITLASDGTDDDLTIAVTGGNNASLVLASSGTASDAMQLTTTAGGIVVTNGGASSGEDIVLTSSNASVIINAAEDATDAIDINATAGGIDIDATGASGQDIVITNTGGSVQLVATEDATDAIVLSATAGGIDVDAVGASGQDIVITNTGGSIIIEATEDVADAIYFHATTGGIDITADGAAAKDLDLGCTNGSINITAGESGEDSLVLTSSIGGINIFAAGAAADEDIDIVATGSSVNITSTEANEAAIVLNASTALGGIDITSNADIDITTTGAADEDITISNAGGSINVVATEDSDGAILIHANGGTSEVIKIHADQGDTATSIYLLSDVGGITLQCGSGDDVEIAGPLDMNGAIVGDGTAAISGMLRTVTNDVDGKTVNITESDTVQTNAGGAGAIWNLPEASTAIGMQVTFVTMAAQNLDINPDDADKILGLTDAAGNAIRNATVGNTITLLCVDATNWVVVSNYGTWTDVD